MHFASFRTKTVATISIIVAIFLLDQLTKLWAVVYLKPLHSVDLLGSLLRFTYIENDGFAFGVRFGNPLLINILSMIAVCLIFYFLFQLRNHIWLRIAFAAIIGGACGNLLDRMLFGKVVDFIDIDFVNIHLPSFHFLYWQFPEFSLLRLPVFNFADVAVTMGMLLVIAAALSDGAVHIASRERQPDEA